MDELLTCTALSKWYGPKRALDQLELHVGRGKIIGLLGPNGSGKTTLIKMANGLLVPSTGTIQINGKAPGPESKKVVSYLPDANYLPNWMTVRKLVGMFADFYPDFDRSKAEEMLRDLKIADSERLKHLSKGTKEKVQLILAMSRQAQLYLLDEPIGGVDPAAREYILNTILKNFDESSSILITTHLIQDVEAIFDQVLFLNQGKIVIDGEVDEIRQQHGKSIDRLFREVFKC